MQAQSPGAATLQSSYEITFKAVGLRAFFFNTLLPFPQFQ
jgi:hypothetical protein